MKNFYSTCITGLLAILPLILTIYLFIWLVSGIEAIFRGVFDFILPSSWYIPGMGVIIAIIIIFVVGLTLRLWIFQQLHSYLNKFLEKFPLIGDIYESLNGLMKYFAGQGKEAEGEQVVVVTLGNPEIHLLGIVTCSDLSKAPGGLGDNTMVAVYLPMSYQVGGYTIYVAKDQVKPIHMSKKDVMRWTLTGGAGY